MFHLAEMFLPHWLGCRVCLKGRVMLLLKVKVEVEGAGRSLGRSTLKGHNQRAAQVIIRNVGVSLRPFPLFHNQ